LWRTVDREAEGESDVAHVIAEPCLGVKDGGCISVCPLDCIHPTAEERAFQEEDMLYIDPGVCIDCGLCADECQKGAIFSENALPDQWAHFKRRSAEYYAKHSPQAR
jgi:ferredoxin